MCSSYLTRDLIHSNGAVGHRFFKREIRADKHERHTDAEPERHEREESQERHGAARLLAPDQQIDDKEDGKDEAWHANRGHNRVFLPVLTFELFVETCREIAGKRTHCYEQNHLVF